MGVFSLATGCSWVSLKLKRWWWSHLHALLSSLVIAFIAASVTASGCVSILVGIGNDILCFSLVPDLYCNEIGNTCLDEKR